MIPVIKENFTRLKPDVNGNPRYLICSTYLTTKEERLKLGSNLRWILARKRAINMGGKVYKGGTIYHGIVFKGELTEIIAAINSIHEAN